MTQLAPPGPPAGVYPATGLRERKKDDTRRALIEAAYRFTMDRGFDLFTIAEVATEVGVSRRTFSNYFASKAECVVAINEPQSERVLELLAAADPAEPVDRLIQRLLQLFTADVTDEWADFLQIQFDEPELRKECSRADEQLAAGLASSIATRFGIDPTDVAAQALATFAITAGHAVVERWIVDGRPDGRVGLNRLLGRVFSLLDLRALQALGTSSLQPDEQS